MNPVAIIIGLILGILSAVLCYGVSMVTSGLFARPFYRLYSRVLIGICCVMLVAPALRWLAASSPMMGAFGLSVAQYLAVVVLGYGVYRFNRDFMHRSYLERKTTTYFIFGTLAYATVVTLAFLHVAVQGTPSWSGHGHGYITAGHYGPLLVLLAVMLFDTDSRLKSLSSDPRRFSRFTFVGYAISFLGLSLSTVPFVAEAFHRLSSVAVESPWIQSLSAAEALLIAIGLYGWLVWRYESIPPLFLLLLAIIAEYHVLFTQWVVRAYGPETWGLASLPLFAAVAFLDHYFSKWDERKQSSRDREGIVAEASVDTLRFATPFRVVQWGLAAALFAITLWTHFYSVDVAPVWLGVTFATFSGFFLLSSFARKQPGLIYLAGALAGLAALLGLEAPGGPHSTLVVSILGAVAGGLACLGERRGLKLAWRTPLTDVALVAGLLVIGLVFSRHWVGSDPYRLHAVGLLDGLALLGAMLACVACALQYRSQLPVFGLLIAAVTMIPMWSAGLGLLSTIAAWMINGRIPKDRRLLVEDGVSLFGSVRLPLSDELPQLLSRPLSLGGIPLALLGLAIAMVHLVQGDFSAGALAGSAVAALVLLLLTRSYRQPWLYVTGILATYLAIHAIAQGRWLLGWRDHDALAAHLAIASAISLTGWLVASGYARWCAALLRRCAEEKEDSVRMSRAYYSGLLFHVTAIISLLLLVGTYLLWTQSAPPVWTMPVWTMSSASMEAILFAFAASAYRTKLGSSLSLIALTLAVFIGFEWIGSPLAPQSTVLAGLSLLAAMVSCWSHKGFSREPLAKLETESWLPAIPSLPATGLDLWLRPLAIYALICSPIAVLSVMQGEPTWSLASIWTRPAPVTYAFASITLLLSTRAFRVSAIYIASIALAYAAIHSAAQWALNHQWMVADAKSIHLLVGALFSLAGCLIAILLTMGINRHIQRADKDRHSALAANREFYAGILHHFALLTATLTLLGIAGIAISEQDDFTRFAPLGTGIAGIWIAGILAIAFSVSGIVYLSRLHTYAALTAVVIAMLGMVAIWASPADVQANQLVAVAVLALALGIGSWLLHSPKQVESGSEDEAEGQGMSWRFNQCWQHPPLPLVSRDRTLWAKPLAHASTLLALAAVVPCVMLWGQFPVWVTVTPFYLASCTWLIATFTYGFGLIGALDLLSSPSATSSGESDSRSFERRLLYAASILAVGMGSHVAAQLTAFAAMPIQTFVAWHLVLAAGLSLLGWTVATVIAARLNGAISGGAAALSSSESRDLYSGVLHHVVLAAGIVVLLTAVTFGLPATDLVLPLAMCSGMLVILFALAGATYRSQLGSYLSLASLGWMVVQLSAMGTEGWTPAVAMIAAALSLLGLVLLTIAAINSPVATRELDKTISRRLLPTAWSSPPLPLRADSWSSLWHNPLRQVALLLTQVGVTMVVANIAWRGSWDDWSMHAMVTLFAAAISCAIAAKLYQTSVLTYIATVLVAVGFVPMSQIDGEVGPRLGVAWSLVAVGFWLLGYGFERLRGKESADESDDRSELTLSQIFERPLIRSSAILAIIAVCLSLYDWKLSPETASLTPLLLACGAGTLSLLLNARSMNVLHQFSLGRMLVYLACLAITGVGLIVASTRGGLEAIGPHAAVTALVLCGIGLALMEWARWRSTTTPDRAAAALTFAEPLWRYGCVLALGASLVSVMIAIGYSGYGGNHRLVTSIADWLGTLTIGPVAVTFSIAAVVSLMTVRASRVAIWLDIAVVLGSSGLLLLGNNTMHWSTATLTLVALVSMNGLVVVARLVRSRPHRVESLLGLSEASCERSFFRWPLLVATVCLILQSVYLLMILIGAAKDPGWGWVLNGALCAFLFFHVMYLQPNAALLHLLVASTVVGFFGAFRARGWEVTPDVALSVMGFAWGIVAIQFNRPIGRRVLSMLRLPLTEEEEAASARALIGWAAGLTGVAIAITLPIYWMVRPDFPNLSITLLFASVTSLLAGARWRYVHATTAAAILFPACLAATAVLYMEPRLLRDFAGLATAGLALAYVVTEFRFRRRASSAGDPDTYAIEVSKSLITLAHLFASTAVVLTIASMTILPPSPLFAVAMALVAVAWLWMAWESSRELLVYTSVAAVFAGLLYLCTSLLELTFTPSPIAAFFVIGYSFALYGLNILVGRVDNPRAGVFVNPTYYMAMLAPIVLPLVTPLDEKLVAAFTCLAAGSFYLVVSQRSQARWTMYVAAALFNMAIYLWLPEAKQLTGLAQLYVIPAAVTVLLFAQLHRNDLKPNALRGIRSAAAGAILAVSTLEVFFADDSGLLQFIVVLLLSLAGIAAGISLRIRPFVSIGIAFLVINVVGQLGLQFHHETGVIRAVILIGIGVLVLAAMIFFNIHRERIMSRYRGFIAEENWQ